MKIIIPGIPIAKARHKACRRGNFISMYDPQEAQKNKTKLLLRQLSGNSGQLGPLKISFTFYFPYPKDRFEWIEPIHIGKPDVDNICKYFLDCSNKILFDDDKQIVEIYAKKLYSEQPRTEIEIMPLDDIDIDENSMKVLRIFTPQLLKSMLDEFNKLNQLYQKLENSRMQPSYPSLLSTAASLLVSISKQYTDPLSKLKKITDIPCDQSLFQTALGQHSTEIY